MDKIGRLRALEKDIRSSGGPGCQYLADQLASLIAELGQEVAAVPNGKLVGWWNGITPGFDGMGVPSVRWGADAENSRHDIPLYDGYNPIHYVTPPTSPAHTSEARDAGLLDALRKIYEWEPYDAMSYGARRLAAQALNDYDAAMRQEAG